MGDGVSTLDFMSLLSYRSNRLLLKQNSNASAKPKRERLCIVDSVIVDINISFRRRPRTLYLIMFKQNELFFRSTI
jgi:hypothetical protein